MELIKGNAYFCKVKNAIKQYPYLDKNINCQVLIVGGGIMGAISNYYISQHFDTVLVEKSRLGYGCSSCSTALLEYILDDSPNTLSKYLNKKEIVDIYKMGQQGLAQIGNFIKEVGNDCEYSTKDVLLYSNRSSDDKQMEKEYQFLADNGFDCRLITDDNNPFNFKISRGIYLPQSGAEANTYLLAKQLFENSKNQKCIYENTEVVSYTKCTDGYKVQTNYGDTITCKQIVFATGFNFNLFSKKRLCESALTYAIITQPLLDFNWHNNALVQDALQPYHYLRKLPDGRILIGGEDIDFNFGDVIEEKQSQKKYDKLLKTLKEIFPQIANKIHVEYSFCGAFGSTDNNIGMVGEWEKDVYLFLSMGANGIVNAFYAIDIILNSLKNQPAPLLANQFSPQRIK